MFQMVDSEWQHTPFWSSILSHNSTWSHRSQPSAHIHLKSERKSSLHFKQSFWQKRQNKISHDVADKFNELFVQINSSGFTVEFIYFPLTWLQGRKKSLLSWPKREKYKSAEVFVCACMYTDHTHRHQQRVHLDMQLCLLREIHYQFSRYFGKNKRKSGK